MTSMQSIPSFLLALLVSVLSHGVAASPMDGDLSSGYGAVDSQDGSGKTPKVKKKGGPDADKDKEEAAKKKETSLRVATRDSYSIYSTGLFQEVYIDDNLNLYKTRQYGGIVPSLEEKRGSDLTVPVGEPGDKLTISRIGFEQRELFSRMFVLGTGAMSPWIYDNFAQAQGNPEIDYQIIVEIPTARIPKYNDRRPLVTSAFNSPVASIEGRPMKGGGVKVVLTLKKEARYLPVQVGRLLFIDVER